MFTTQEESTIAQWIEMFPTCKTADELLAKVMDHMNSFSAKMANPTNLQLAKDTLFLQLSKQEGLTITNMEKNNTLIDEEAECRECDQLSPFIA